MFLPNFAKIIFDVDFQRGVNKLRAMPPEGIEGADLSQSAVPAIFQIFFFKMVQKHQRDSIAIICTIEICSIGDIAEIVWTFPDHFRCAAILRYGNCNDYV